MDSSPPKAREAHYREWWQVFDPRLSLRARAALLFGGMILGLTLLVSWLAAQMLQGQIERQIGTHFETLAFQIIDKIDRAIYERSRELVFASNLPALRNPNASPAELRKALETVQDNSPDFAWLGLADPAGRVVAATRGTFEGSSVGDTAWHRTGRTRTFAGPPREIPELSLAAGGNNRETPRYLNLALPIMSATGQSQAVLGAQLKWGWVRDVQYSVVADAAGRDRLGVTIYGAAGETLLDSGGSGWTEPPEAPSVADKGRLRGSLIESTSGGTVYVTAFARSRGFKEYRGLGWLTTVRQPVEFAFAPVRELRRTITRWGLFLTGIAVVVSWIAAGSVARRIRSVTASADRIRDGDVLALMPQLRNESEIGRMCAAVSDLVDDLRQRQDKLEAENQSLAARQENTAAAARPEKD